MHFRALDFYRFLAAMGVVLFHYSHKVDGPELQSLRYIADFFFVLSGFVIMKSANDIGRADVVPFYLKRFLRIWPLHILTLGLLVLYAATRIALLGTTSRHFDWSSLPQQIFMIHAWATTDTATWNTPAWSISAVWFVYLLFPLFLACYRRWSVWSLLALSGGAWAALTMNDWLDPGRPWTSATHDWGAVRAVPSFLLGMTLNAFPRMDVSGASAWMALAAVVASLFLDLPGPAYVPIFAALIYVTVSAHAPKWMTGKLAKEGGNLSYGLCLLHVPVLLVSFNLLGRWAPHVLLAAVAAAGTLGLSWVVFHHFDKPGRDLIATWTASGKLVLGDDEPRAGSI